MNNRPSTAQQIRVWAGLAVGILAAISTFGMSGSLVSQGNTLFTSNSGGYFAWFGFAIVCFVALGILAGFTIYRIYSPAAPKIHPPSPLGPYGVQPPPPPAYGSYQPTQPDPGGWHLDPNLPQQGPYSKFPPPPPQRQQPGQPTQPEHGLDGPQND